MNKVLGWLMVAPLIVSLCAMIVYYLFLVPLTLLLIVTVVGVLMVLLAGYGLDILIEEYSQDE